MRSFKSLSRVLLFLCLSTLPVSLCRADGVKQTYRAIWGHGIREWDINTWDALADAGLDTVLVTTNGTARKRFWYNDTATVADVKAMAVRAAAAGMRIVPGMALGYNQNQAYPEPYPCTVTAKGTLEKNLPCPLNERYWKDFIIGGACKVAELSLANANICGVHFDTEMYGGIETSGPISNIYCFCDDCFNGFLKSRKLDSPVIAPGARQGWLKDRNLLNDYYAGLEKRAEALASRLRREIDRINPQIVVSFYLLEDSWFYRGFAKGLYRKGMPLPIFDYACYFGYIPRRAEEVRKILAASNPEMVCIPGFYTRAVPAARIGANCRPALKNDGGYWIWNEMTPLPLSYLDGIRAANRSVDLGRSWWSFDFGTKDSPVAQGYVGVSKDTKYDAGKGYGWRVAPLSEVWRGGDDYPSDPLLSDNLTATANIKPVFRVDLPAKGKYEVKLWFGDPYDREWRPLGIVEINGKRVMSGVTPTGGNVLPVRCIIDVQEPFLEICYYTGHPKGTTAAAGLEVRKITEKQIAPPHPAEGIGTPEWIRTEKIRMLYGGSLSYYTSEQWRKGVVSSGCNAAAVNFDRYVAKLLSGKVRLFYSKSYAADEAYRLNMRNMRKVVYWDGKADTKPCPLEEQAWKTLFLDDAKQLIARCKEWDVRLDGYLLDLEMYGSSHGDVYGNRCCFCDHCFNGFFKERGVQAPAVGASARFGYLKQNGMLTDYYRYLEDGVAGIIDGVEREIHRIKPDLVLGYLQMAGNWFFRGLNRGLNSREIPFLIMSENEYDGYWFSGKDVSMRLERDGLNALYLPGISGDTNLPPNLTAHCYSAAMDTSGYWIFGMDNTDAGWKALVTCNSAIDDSLKTGKISGKIKADPDMQLRPVNWRAARENEELKKNPDAHITKLVPLPAADKAAYRFDFGTPDSPVMKGYTQIITTTLYNEKTGYGWEELPFHSLDRDQAQPLDDLTRDGIVTQGRRTFKVKLDSGRYKVTVILGDMNPREPRPYQNVYLEGVKRVNEVL
ncbi:MAG: hypothetical protein PHT33_07685, partial [bacterium]|nr:hypothetical protein [bacterium]